MHVMYHCMCNKTQEIEFSVLTDLKFYEGAEMRARIYKSDIFCVKMLSGNETAENIDGIMS